MSNGSWQDLYGRWKDRLDDAVGREPREPGHWFSIWRMIMQHPWFQQRLRHCAEYEIRTSNLPRDLTDDLEQEVILLLAGKLARRRDLGMDVELAEEKFAAFLGTIIRNDCRQIVRKLRRQFLRSASLPVLQGVADRSGQSQALMDMTLEIEELDDPQRTILLLKSKGMTLKEIAQQIQLNYSKVCREYHSACRRLAALRKHTVPK